MATLTVSSTSFFFENRQAAPKVPPVVCGCGSQPQCIAGLSKRAGEAGFLPSTYGLKRFGRSSLLARRNQTQRRRILTRSQVSVGLDSPGVENVEKAEAGDSVHNIVIVGSGIAGLAAAVALHRVGLKALVLEQSSTIRSSGAALTLWTNAWRALDYLGVGEALRENHSLCSRLAVYSQTGELLKTIYFEDAPGGPHETRSVERKALMDNLAAQLPDGTIQLNARVTAIEKQPKQTFTNVYLENGSVVRAKVVIGCDGVNSVVCRWMGIAHPRYAGYIGIRGVAEFPDKHQYGTEFAQYMGNGPRAGVIPFTDKRVYWFISFSRSDPGHKITDPNLVKEALRVLNDEGFPEHVKALVHNTPIEMFTRAALQDRWNIPGVVPPLVKDGVTLAGDALHPMTPNLGQGGCTAIEDGIVLARSLAGAFTHEGVDGNDHYVAEKIHKALEEDISERQKRTLPIVLRSSIMGTLLGIGFPPVVFIRNRIALPKIVTARSLLNHTLYDVGALPQTKVLAS